MFIFMHQQHKRRVSVSWRWDGERDKRSSSGKERIAGSFLYLMDKFSVAWRLRSNVVYVRLEKGQMLSLWNKLSTDKCKQESRRERNEREFEEGVEGIERDEIKWEKG